MKKKYYLLIAVISIVINAVSCSSDDHDDVDVSISPSSLSMHHDDTQRLSYKNIDSWSSENEFVAIVDNEGLVTGGHVGSTRIIGQGGKHKSYCDVTIVPVYNLFDTPICDWGTSMSNIKTKERHSLSSGSNEKTLVYDYTKSDVPILASYVFDNGRLNSIFVVLPFSKYLITTYHLAERYQPAAYDGDIDVMYVDAYEKANIKTAILQSTMTISGGTVTSVFYASYAEIEKNSSSSKIINKLQMEQEDFVMRKAFQFEKNIFK